MPITPPYPATPGGFRAHSHVEVRGGGEGRDSSTGRQKTTKSATDVFLSLGCQQLEIGAVIVDGKSFVFLLPSIGVSKILNMSNNVEVKEG